MTDAQFTALYSEECAERFGSSIWRTPDGREVEVTSREGGPVPQFTFPDTVIVGPVVEFIRDGRPDKSKLFKAPG